MNHLSKACVKCLQASIVCLATWAVAGHAWRFGVQILMAFYAHAVDMLQNGVVFGSIVVGAWAIMVGMATLAMHYCWELARNATTLTVSVSSGRETAIYNLIIAWLAEHPGLQTSTIVELSSMRSDSDYQDDDADDDAMPTPAFIPARGVSSMLMFEGRPVWFKILERRDPETGYGYVLVIRALGTDRAIIQRIIKGAHEAEKRRRTRRTAVWCHSTDGCWNRRPAWRTTRPLATLVLEGQQAETLLADMQTFFQSKSWYNERGIPHRRGYLFHGPPGCGKTSSVLALAGVLGLPVCPVDLSATNMSNDALRQLMITAPARAILLFEDVDAAFLQAKPKPAAALAQSPDDSDQADDEGSSAKDAPRNRSAVTNVTFSGLLNAMDGVASFEDKVIILTTNHADDLDPALVRPGRVDVRVLFPHATRHMVRSMFAQFYGEASESDLPDKFAQLVPPNTVSMAEIQGFLMHHRNDPSAAVAAAGEWIASRERPVGLAGAAQPGTTVEPPLNN